MERGFLFRPNLRPSFRPRRRAATVSFGTPHHRGKWRRGGWRDGDCAWGCVEICRKPRDREGSDESAFSSRDKRRFFERDSGAPFCLAKEHACGLDTKIENVQ